MRRIVTLLLLSLLVLPAFAKEKPQTSDVTRDESRFYSDSSKSAQTCPHVLTDEDDLFKSVQDALYQKLAKHWHEFQELHDKPFIALVDIGKDGTLITYRIAQGLPDKSSQVAFSTMLNHVFPNFKFDPLPTEYKLPRATFVLSSTGIQYYEDVAKNPDALPTVDPNQKQTAIETWLDQLNTYLKETWTPPKPKGKTNHRGELMLSVGPDGQIIKRRLITSSCDPDLDRSILEAIDGLPKSDNLKLPALPFKPELGYIRVLYVFDTKR